jgi:hypothetical protein
MASRFAGFSRAVPLGLAGALIGCGVWFVASAMTNRHLSAISILVGVAVGHGIHGKDSRRGARFQVLGGAMTLVALLITEAFVMRMLVVRELVELGSANELPLLLPFRVMWDLVAAGITGDPPMSLFWGVALWYAVSVPKKRPFE